LKRGNKAGFQLMKIRFGNLFSSKRETNHTQNEQNPHETKAQKKLRKKTEKLEKKYAKLHNQLADKIELRNKAERTLGTQIADVVTTDGAVQRVGLSVAQNNGHVGQLIDNNLAQTCIGPTMGRGIMSGFANKKAETQNLTSDEYANPTAGNYVETGITGLGMTGGVAKTAYRQNQVTKTSIRFGKAKRELKDVRLTNLAQENGHLRAHKHGKIQSGSFQANSPEELEMALKRTEPTSHVSGTDIPLQTPGLKNLLPGEAPEKLPIPVFSQQGRRSHGRELTPRERVERELADREQRILKLEEELRRQDPTELQRAVQERDYQQSLTGIDALKGVVKAPVESITLVTNYALNKLPDWSWKPTIGNGTRTQAEYRVGQSIGHEFGNGNAEKMLPAQVRVENLHIQGKPIARELRDLQKQKAMEADLNMSVDSDGDKFYDAYESFDEMEAADYRYEQSAQGRLPRQADKLYLDDNVAEFLPLPSRVTDFSHIGEFIRRPLNALLNPPNT
jgi:hypothetical protein